MTLASVLESKSGNRETRQEARARIPPGNSGGEVRVGAGAVVRSGHIWVYFEGTDNRIY